MGKKFVIKNAQGENVNITLDAREQKIANNVQKMALQNDYKVDITTLTTIMKAVTETQYYTVRPSDFLPVKVGEGAWSSELLTYVSTSHGGKFEDGIIDQGKDNGDLASADAGVRGVQVPVKNWAKKIGWSLFDVQQASKSGSWDIVSARAESRKENYDLGIQKVAFLGIKGNSDIKGLLTLDNITKDASTISKPISEMDASEFQAFVATVLAKYRVNAKHTVMPDRFYLPENDFLGLGAAVSATFPNKTKIEYLTEMFRMMTNNPSFEVKPLAYANKAINKEVGLNKNRYVLCRYNEKSFRMDIPVDYNATLANTTDGFSFSNVAYAQFTGVEAYRPDELLYFDN